MTAQQQRKIGPVMLSGLIIGPILGSGIIILPPMAYGVARQWALPAWAVITVIGFGFAWVFARLTLLYPGESGVSEAIEAAFGTRFKHLASFYLVGAVCVGPVVVMLTAAHYLLPQAAALRPYAALVLILIVAILLLQRLAFIGGLSLLFSSLAALILFGGSLRILFEGGAVPWTAGANDPFDPAGFGHTLLLLFWTIVGWEVIGNYSGEVRRPERTIPRAVLFGAVSISTVSLTVAAAVHVLGEAGTVSMATIVGALSGQAGQGTMALLTSGLCLTTCLLFVGAVARLIRALAVAGLLPQILKISVKRGAPFAAIVLLTVIHLLILLAVAKGLLDDRQLVAIADGFFVGNALIGLLAAFRLLTGTWSRLVIVILIAVFTALLLQVSLPVLTVMAALAAAIGLRGSAAEGKTAAALVIGDEPGCGDGR